MKSKIFKSLFSLDVPADITKRGEIRAGIEAYFQENPVMPPVSYDALVGYASSMIESEKWEERYRAFIMVCCGNAIWHPVVGAIPYNRRIFLLPQCLRNVALCKAEQDELGLLCSECGNCSISGFLREAENLGWMGVDVGPVAVTGIADHDVEVDAEQHPVGQ